MSVLQPASVVVAVSVVARILGIHTRVSTLVFFSNSKPGFVPTKIMPVLVERWLLKKEDLLNCVISLFKSQSAWWGWVPPSASV